MNTLKRVLLIVAALAVAAPIVSQNLPVGQFPATQTNDNACVGCVGEYMSIWVNNTNGTATFTNATPTVVTVASWSNGSPQTNCFPTTGVSCIQPICFINSGGALPTGISACGTQQYYIDPASWSGTSFKIALTAANALAGTDVGATSTGTGTQTGFNVVQLASAANITGTSADVVAALVTTVGDWSCAGTALAQPNGATTTSLNQASIGGAALSGPQLQSNGFAQDSTALGAGLSSSISTGPVRRLLGSTTLTNLAHKMTFATNIMQDIAGMYCRRER